MLTNLKSFYGKKLAACDGNIGHVRDFYFHSKIWQVRYLVVDTGSWISSRKVLLSKQAFEADAFMRYEKDDHPIDVKLTKKQIEDSPTIASHLPVSRQNEVEYFSYYGWPAYWQEGSFWLSPHTGTLGGEIIGIPDGSDQDLRSTRDVTGYRIQALDGDVGSVSGFVMDAVSWELRQIVVETGHWYSGKEIFVLPRDVTSISDAEHSIHVKLTMEDMRKTLADTVAHSEGGLR